MRTALLLASALLLSACSVLDSEGADADLENSLPVDGCSWVVHIRGSDYAPDRASLTAITEFAGTKPGITKAKVIYQVTGDTGHVECGWGGKKALPEVSLLQISAP